MAFSGVYHGVRFRSLLELSVIRNLEDSGLVLGSTMLYEETRVPYGKTRKRTYVIDLTLPQTRTLIEVKPTSRVSGRRNVAKRLGAEEWARENGWTYVIITEREVRECGQLLTLKDAALIDGIQWDQRAKRRIDRTKSKKRKTKR